jgi:hypothetical protein
VRSDGSAAHCAALVKDRSPARYVAALFAPAPTRRFLFALYALASELKNVRRAAREPLIVDMRFQWWTDALAALPDNPRGHPVLQELAAAMSFGALASAPLIELVQEEAFAEAVGVAIATGSREFLAEARRLWRRERRMRRAELPAYLPATFVDVRHPVTDFALRWRALVRGLSNRF